MCEELKTLLLFLFFFYTHAYMHKNMKRLIIMCMKWTTGEILSRVFIILNTAECFHGVDVVSFLTPKVLLATVWLFIVVMYVGACLLVFNVLRTTLRIKGCTSCPALIWCLFVLCMGVCVYVCLSRMTLREKVELCKEGGGIPLHFVITLFNPLVCS